MTTQPSAHQVVLHMVRKSGGNSFTAMEILKLFTFSQNVLPQLMYMVHKPNQVTQCKMLSKSTFEKIPTGTYPFTKHPIGQQDNVEHAESEGSFLAPS